MSAPRELCVQEVVSGLDLKGRMLKGRGGYFIHQQFLRKKGKKNQVLQKVDEGDIKYIIIGCFGHRGVVESER